MARVVVVTGSASGIGQATKSLLECRGDHVIGVDLHDADIEADLSTTDGRRTLIDEVHNRSNGVVDAVYAIAGLSRPTPPTAAVNYFGMVATLEGLRPLLLNSLNPRAVAVSSLAGFFPADDELVTKMLAGDEAATMHRAEQLASERRGHLIYNSSKQALYALDPPARRYSRMGWGVDPSQRGRSRHRRHTDVGAVHRHGGSGGGAPRAHADAVERHRPSAGRGRGVGLAGEPSEFAPLRTGPLCRRWQRCRPARRRGLVTARAARKGVSLLRSHTGTVYLPSSRALSDERHGAPPHCHQVRSTPQRKPSSWRLV